MGFFSNIISASVKTVLTPVAIVKDAIDIVKGDINADATKRLLDSAKEDAEEALDDLYGL